MSYSEPTLFEVPEPAPVAPPSLAQIQRDLRPRWSDYHGRHKPCDNCVRAQVDRIRHWQLINGDYAEAPDIEATWYIDPPYTSIDHRYRFGSRQLDYRNLADWCRERSGQVMVCEQVGADWLPFRPFMLAKATDGAKRDGVSKEAIWTNDEVDDERAA